MKVHNISKLIQNYAKEIGIDLIGFAPTEIDANDEKRFRSFIDDGRQGQMGYLEDINKRINIDSILPGAKSVIVIAVNYFQEAQKTPKENGTVARYAYGRDYHKVIKSLLKKLEKYIQKLKPEAQTKICTDSAPIMEKSYAAKAGLGFIGKNTNLITKEFGSFVLLGEIVTDLELAYNKPANGTCGTCTRCIDACPTKALTDPYKMDARRCISYLTIENKHDIPREFHKKIGTRIFGCDTCQEVCPYNKVLAKQTNQKDFRTQIAGANLSLKEILSIKTDDEYLNRFAGSPLMRAKRTGLQRNAKIIFKNTPGVR